MVLSVGTPGDTQQKCGGALDIPVAEAKILCISVATIKLNLELKKNHAVYFLFCSTNFKLL